MDEIQGFLNDENKEGKFFKAENAIKVCRDLGDIERAIRIADKTKMNHELIALYIQNKKQFKKAIELITSRRIQLGE